MSKLGDEPAYPLAYSLDPPANAPGLTKRELFAAIAMQGFLAGEKQQGISGAHMLLDERANAAVAQADALLDELAEEDEDAQST